MFTIMNAESLWIGTDMKRFNEVRDALDSKHIPYKYKVKNRLGEWNGRGTTRGRMGSIGTSTDQMYQYEVIVYKKDLEEAKRCILT